jgi:di/tricarboxylate transporter
VEEVSSAAAAVTQLFSNLTHEDMIFPILLCLVLLVGNHTQFHSAQVICIIAE